MELSNNQRKLQINRGNLSDPLIQAKLLRNYAGIFPLNIKEFGDKVIPRLRKLKNYSK